MVLDDRRIKIRKITEAVSISKKRVYHNDRRFRDEKDIRPLGAVAH